VRTRGVVVRAVRERNYALAQRVDATGHGSGPLVFFHKGAQRAAQRGPAPLPPVNARITFVLVAGPDGRPRGEDVTTEGED
jgi:hypothetical protein